MKKIYNKIKFSKRTSVLEIEEGNKLCPRFNKDKLLPCITIEYKTKEILMFSYINEDAFKKSINTKKAHYYSRTRKKIWFKGETSGMFHNIKKMLIDDDQDCVIFEVKLTKPKKGGNEASCHVGYKSCFYRKIECKDGNISLKFIEKKKSFDPNLVYKDIPNPTKI
ncbi:phosphoribosyl-AMP cyclohydrolase [Alphaproteobacteria bacterium]|nr:phosphoribosyl-AMP cyclohydrolase [Alphaproteobacteria bacterium]